MRFSQFMHEWLYGKGGYYSHFRQIGKSGDFYTAVSTSQLFGGSIANYIYRLIQRGELSSNATIMEIGAHRGYLLADIVQFLYTFDKSLIKSLRFAILEPFKALREEQKRYFRQSFGQAVELEHYSTLEEIEKKEGFILANEIFDAFPCELYFKEEMGYVKDFSIFFDKSDSFVAQKAKRYGIEKGEIALGYEEFAKKLFKAFAKARFITFDYGDLTPRNDFSIRVYTKHKVYPLFDKTLDIGAAYKKSDITYDVNFSHLIDAFKEANWQKKAFKTQLVALIDFGITQLLETIMQKAGFEAYKREADKVKILIHPSLMGERFKMVEFLKV